MSQQPNRNLTPENLGFLPGLLLRVRLILKLMGDPRVNPVLKLLPIAAILYWFIPTDLIPLIPLDDAAVLYIGGALFIELCPPEVVAEYTRLLRAESEGTAQTGEESVIDAEFRDVSGRSEQRHDD